LFPSHAAAQIQAILYHSRVVEYFSPLGQNALKVIPGAAQARQSMPRFDFGHYHDRRGACAAFEFNGACGAILAIQLHNNAWLHELPALGLVQRPGQNSENAPHNDDGQLRLLGWPDAGWHLPISYLPLV